MLSGAGVQRSGTLAQSKHPYLGIAVASIRVSEIRPQAVPFREKKKEKLAFFGLNFPDAHLDCLHKHSPLPNTVAGPSGSAIFFIRLSTAPRNSNFPVS